MDLKYEPRVVKHVCHEVGQKHDPCLVYMYRLCIPMCEIIIPSTDASAALPEAPLQVPSHNNTNTFRGLYWL